MKKTLRLMGLCALAVLALAGCKKDDQTAGKTSVKATISQLKGGTKTGVNAGNCLVWNNGDQIKVYNSTTTSAVFATEDDDVTSANFTSQETLDVTDGCVAFYPAADVTVSEGNYILPLKAVQDGTANTFAPGTYPMYALYDNGNFAFQSPCALLGLPLNGDATIGSIVLTSANPNEKLSGYYSFVPGDMIFQSVGTTDPYPFVGIGNSVALDFGDSGLQLTDVTTTVYFTLPAFRLADGFTVEFKGLDGSTLFTKTAGAHEENLTSAQTILMMPAVTVNALTGAINGLFSVSATQQVYFSQGNLQYIGSASTPYWKFADHQWDRIGTGQNVSDANIDRDYFGWGTSGYNHGATCYQPWATGTTHSDYFAYGNANYDLNSQTPMTADWGYNAISNGGNTENIGWRTLTQSEWNYVINNRNASTVNGTANARFAKASLDGINGVILFPDVYTHPVGLTQPTNINVTSSGFNNSYTIAEFELMQAQGAVFLPAASARTDAGSFNQYGIYWSASHHNYSDNSRGYSVGFWNNSFPTANSTFRSSGLSVRLVMDKE